VAFLIEKGTEYSAVWGKIPNMVLLSVSKKTGDFYFKEEKP
jgi:hypothetical protein